MIELKIEGIDVGRSTGIVAGVVTTSFVSAVPAAAAMKRDTVAVAHWQITLILCLATALAFVKMMKTFRLLSWRQVLLKRAQDPKLNQAEAAEIRASYIPRDSWSAPRISSSAS